MLFRSNSFQTSSQGIVYISGGQVVSGAEIWGEVEVEGILWWTHLIEYTTRVCPGAYINFSVGKGNNDKTYGTCP